MHARSPPPRSHPPHSNRPSQERGRLQMARRLRRAGRIILRTPSINCNKQLMRREDPGKSRRLMDCYPAPPYILMWRGCTETLLARAAPHSACTVTLAHAATHFGVHRDSACACCDSFCMGSIPSGVCRDPVSTCCASFCVYRDPARAYYVSFCVCRDPTCACCNSIWRT
jgi:hypothetical protein